MSGSKADALRAIVDSLRSRSGIEYATARLALQTSHGEELAWKDYVRGKDLAKFLRGKQELLDEHTRPQGQGRGQDDQVADLVCRLVERKLLVPAERRFKRPKPGKKKLVKWPRTLDPVPPAGFAFSQELFYALACDQPTGWWFYLGAALLALGVLGFTLFPLAPYAVRVTVLYLLSGLLSAILGTVALRYALWLAVWLAAGAHFWLLPNMLSEELPITEILSPLYSFDRGGGPSSSLPLRAGVAALLAGGGYALYAAGPDAAVVRGGLQGARDSVLTYFDVVGSARAGLTNGTSTTGINLKATKAPAAAEANANANASASNGERPPPPEEAEAGAGGGGEL